jgi:putative component of toxin-antitoxin plasmid stabilization module
MFQCFPGALIVMLGGCNKSSQTGDIERAKQLAKEWQ